MIEISFLTGQCLVVAGWIVYRFAAYQKTGSFSWKREIALSLWLINLLVICRMTFHPFLRVDGKVQPLVFEWDAIWPPRLRLIPFVNMFDYATTLESLVNVIGNFAMFIPTGILTPLLWKNRASLGKVAATGFLLSLSIELIQLPFAVRTSDVDDLILNTAGTLAGYGIYKLIKLLRRH